MNVSYRIYRLVRWGAFGAGTLVLLLCGSALYFSHQFFDATASVDHTTAVIGEIRATRVLLGPESHFTLSQPVPVVSVPAILGQFEHVAQLTSDNPVQQGNVQEFRALFSPAKGRDTADPDPAALHAAHDALGHMQSEEYRLLSVRTANLAYASRKAAVAVSALCGALLLVGLVIAIAARREFRLREEADQTLLSEKQDLTRYSRELALVSAGSELIQAAQDESQLNAAVAQILREMVPESSGYFALVSPSRDMVEIGGFWGFDKVPDSFPPSDCVALQLGRKIHRSESLVHLPCRHVHGDSDCICLPLRGASGFLGVLHVQSTTPILRKRADSIGLFSAQVTLGLTNLRMRDALRSQTVRDSLTGLFNRRYFDETLQRELAAYRRDGAPISVLMLDLDHFKKVNDTYGHAAGDDALRAMGRLMKSSFRESDVICRYGGEEFAVILINTDLTKAYSKAESFRRLVEQNELSWNGRDLGHLTASIGVASCTEFEEPENLVQAADAALYQAKRMGRNSTCVCSDQQMPMPAIKGPAPQEPVWTMATDTSLTNERAAGRGGASRVLPINVPPSRPA